MSHTQFSKNFSINTLKQKLITNNKLKINLLNLSYSKKANRKRNLRHKIICYHVTL
jgi:hypothetical protein